MVRKTGARGRCEVNVTYTKSGTAVKGKGFGEGGEGWGNQVTVGEGITRDRGLWGKNGRVRERGLKREGCALAVSCCLAEQHTLCAAGFDPASSVPSQEALEYFARRRRLVNCTAKSKTGVHPSSTIRTRTAVAGFDFAVAEAARIWIRVQLCAHRHSRCNQLRRCTFSV
eukprot:3932171-Rhodomonas_salina.2